MKEIVNRYVHNSTRYGTVILSGLLSAMDDVDDTLSPGIGDNIFSAPLQSNTKLKSFECTYGRVLQGGYWLRFCRRFITLTANIVIFLSWFKICPFVKLMHRVLKRVTSTSSIMVVLIRQLFSKVLRSEPLESKEVSTV